MTDSDRWRAYWDRQAGRYDGAMDYWSPAMLAIARERAAALGRPADLRLGDAQALEFPDGTFDTVLCMLALQNLNLRVEETQRLRLGLVERVCAR